MTLLGTLGVFGMQDAMSFLIAWEVMSVGGAVMILTERVSKHTGVPVLFMLALLEVGAVAVLLALLLLGNHTGSYEFANPCEDARSGQPGGRCWSACCCSSVSAPNWACFRSTNGSPPPMARAAARLALVFSGIVLNAAFYALARGVLQWLPRNGVWTMERRNRNDHCRRPQCDSDDLQCISGRGLAAPAQSLVRRKCGCGRNRPWRFSALCRQRVARPRGLGMDHLPGASRRTQFGQGHAVP